MQSKFFKLPLLPMPNHPESGNIFPNTLKDKQKPKGLMGVSAGLNLVNLGNLDNFPLPVWVVNQRGHYVKVNAAFCKLSGISQQELPGQCFSTNLPVRNQSSFDQLFNELVQRKENLNKEWEIKTKSGESKFVLSNVVLATDNSHEPLIAFFGTDITGLKNSEEKHKELSRELQQEIDLRETTEDMLLHDVRKPIANILSICSLVVNKEYDKQKTEYWLNVLHSEANKSLKILETKAGLKRLELRNYELEFSCFNILDVIQSILKPLEPRIQKHSLHVKLYLNNVECREKETLMMTADKFFIEIMLNNLITNAIEASPEHAPVSIYLNKQEKEKLQISIHNKGEIPVEVQSRFFHKYATFGKPKGFGIGTYIAKLIACSHKGDISFKSSKQNGTILNIDIPVH